ncbi:Spc7-domain-containing protein [Coniochaeta ligniaria NRRL 30616]|uniref:Spc7-domain-containing protein n=1 Tax=Coniochaeta ligniaria NRRL 30616 TaxID=1408157 RepID=A0A1J7I8X1_9PEZI|nr:Spc7-domain-containing protein [Coniochaeta ligniaria NRRL 30616]
MAPTGDATLPATRRSRQPIGGQSPNKKTSDKENATVDIGSTLAANRKKSRSKSIGPGGLDGIKPSTGNRRVSLAAPSRPPPRSILKQPLQPLPEIPPHKSKAQGGSTKPATPTTDQTTDGSSTSGTKIALRTEEQQQAAAREREERERLEAEKEANSRREARRKSLANRRVSFAAEATLHTFSIEYIQDSTTSTDSTRRASSIAGQLQTPSSDPPEEVEEPEPELPSDKRRRRSSGIPPLNFNNPEDDTLSSTVYSSDSEHTDADGVAEIQGEEMSDSDSDSEVEDGTMMTVDADEMTSASVASVASARSDEGDSTSLDENLRLAARMAATQRLEEEDEEEEIIGFAGWVKKGNAQPKEDDTLKKPEMVQESPEKPEDDGTEMDMDMSMDVDMEMTHAVGGILHSGNEAPEQDEGEDMDMSMDVTRALGGIISHNKPTTRRQSVKPPPQEPEEDDEDVPMDFTMAVGGIKPVRTSDGSQISLEGNEDMSMELTTAIGSVIPLPAKGKSPKQSRRRSVAPRRNNLDDEDGAMDMTVAVGRILPSAPAEIDEDGDEATIGMDMTTAIGNIIKPTSAPQDRQTARKIMEQEADEAGVEAIAAVETKSPPKTKPRLSIADENGSPGMGIFRGKGLRRTPARGGSISTPEASKTEASKTLVDSPANTSTPSPTKPALASTPKTATPSKKAPTPTPAVATPTRAPPPKMLGSRSTSPKRQRQPPPTISTPRSATKPNPKPPFTSSLFHQDPSTGTTTPRVILSPKRRNSRHSGVGIDRPGLGSPRISELLDRRESIGDSALSFSPAAAPILLRSKGVSFADPREMEEEVDRERQAEEDRENRRKILEREADGDGEDVTANLREMIQSLSPKKARAPMRGRKSLHVGSARGVLGKRPAELDEDEQEEEEDSGGVKRLKGLVGSPVKNVRLGGPPSKAETTTGRRTRAATAARVDGGDKENALTPSLSSPVKVSSPKGQGRFRDVDDEPTNTFSFEHPQAMGGGEREEAEEGDEDRIHLQDFLNMTSIRFMELTTTKRRHTVAPAPQRESGAAEDGDVSLEKCVVAGACTVPMLELFQHSCRELKKYISEGRRIVREIETETFVENPPLFREYISASPEFKLIMDNQFKNVKTHARLLSKAMWYEWRMKLQDGLKEGLIKIAEGMTNDDELLREQEELLASVVPDLVKRFEALQQENEELEAVARELADCDPAELEAARADLAAVDEEIEEKSKKLAAMRQELEESERSVKDMSSRKQQCLDDIKAADQVREECRGWSSSEIANLKGKVELLEKQHGWAITGIVDSTVSLTYRREIELVLDISSFQPGNKPNSRVDLWYIADKHEYRPVPATVEREFFLQCIRDQVRGLPQSQTKISRVLAVVSAAWDMGRGVADHVRLLNVQFPTTVSKTSDSEICVRSSLVLVPLASKVEVVLSLRQRMAETGDVEVEIVPRAEVVYGETFKTDKVAEFLAGRIGTRVKGWQEKGESWLDVVAELHGRLVARGRK